MLLAIVAMSNTGIRHDTYSLRNYGQESADLVNADTFSQLLVLSHFVIGAWSHTN